MTWCLLIGFRSFRSRRSGKRKTNDPRDEAVYLKQTNIIYGHMFIAEISPGVPDEPTLHNDGYNGNMAVLFQNHR